MKQNQIKSAEGSRRAIKRIGRGATRGNYAGRGMKGQNARTGGGVRAGFEGGQTPLVRRMPKLKGFKNPNRIPFFALNLDRLDIFEDGATVDQKALLEKGLIRKKMLIKLLADGELKKKLTLHVDAASKKAIEKVEKAGGKVVMPKSEVAESKES